uniref:Uncharacterized protein n=1 Tax=Mucochytrium quahogii TaxID=96639 RepID=A0A7S2SFA2_9STRA|mmetsp:Transcript_30271/g.48179  ORF Transcript_30271/g.48179 Transcript_30271/m.48179 type:complete len:394 (+) Transcript_30271:87-1268(+)|eukprot:CAMPEP_0203765488 /NCGR_PEP_ID=MMETSP0098-20131031/18424_1 /ASSEMBLY_ACC=CAM_ASM_000208 /TAXON_ID=96639 /ORGANISM=" , Strain NY0313808BC1" /LENGTH=393 /DNA_ID=CAMNT_0050661745 /DNA_START=92 /DNA_END=1273 /DNA_ORIENTATION=-
MNARVLIFEWVTNGKRIKLVYTEEDIQPMLADERVQVNIVETESPPKILPADAELTDSSSTSCSLSDADTVGGDSWCEQPNEFVANDTCVSKCPGKEEGYSLSWDIKRSSLDSDNSFWGQTEKASFGESDTDEFKSEIEVDRLVLLPNSKCQDETWKDADEFMEEEKEEDWLEVSLAANRGAQWVIDACDPNFRQDEANNPFAGRTPAKGAPSDSLDLEWKGAAEFMMDEEKEEDWLEASLEANRGAQWVKDVCVPNFRQDETKNPFESGKVPDGEALLNDLAQFFGCRHVLLSKEEKLEEEKAKKENRVAKIESLSEKIAKQDALNKEKQLLNLLPQASSDTPCIASSTVPNTKPKPSRSRKRLNRVACSDHIARIRNARNKKATKKATRWN